jgi:hypothetical protein
VTHFGARVSLAALCCADDSGGAALSTAAHVALTVIVVSLTLVFALALPSLSAVFAFTGAASAMPYSYVFPCALFLAAYRRVRANRGHLHRGSIAGIDDEGGDVIEFDVAPDSAATDNAPADGNVDGVAGESATASDTPEQRSVSASPNTVSDAEVVQVEMVRLPRASRSDDAAEDGVHAADAIAPEPEAEEASGLPRPTRTVAGVRYTALRDDRRALQAIFTKPMAAMAIAFLALTSVLCVISVYVTGAALIAKLQQ